jgi:hypothetical protein
MLQKELLTQKDYATLGQEISHQTANDFIQDYQKSFPEAPSGYALGRNIIEKILAQPGCVGMRFHYGLNAEGQKTLVYIGMDANGNDLKEITMVTENGTIVSQDATVADWIFVLWPK